LKAVKGNKIYTIDETQKNFYIKSGFDIKDDDGKIINYGAGKTISYDKFKEIEDKNSKLEKENKKLKEELKKVTEKDA